MLYVPFLPFHSSDIELHHYITLLFVCYIPAFENTLKVRNANSQRFDPFSRGPLSCEKEIIFDIQIPDSTRYVEAIS